MKRAAIIRNSRPLAAMALLLAGTTLQAEIPMIEKVEATSSAGTWRFDVTLSHPDSGWDHYADAWEIVDADGNPLGLRELAHPHVNEQPFTRSLSGIAMPEGMQQFFVRARCNKDGWGEPQGPFTLD